MANWYLSWRKLPLKHTWPALQTQVAGKVLPASVFHGSPMSQLKKCTNGKFHKAKLTQSLWKLKYT